MASSAEADVQQLVLPGGRALAYAIYGSQTPSHHVFYFHSYPASRLEGAMLYEAAASRGLQLICPDRPGYGCSTFYPERQILDWADDMLALADHLRIVQFACLGVSGGGPYVMACYHKMPRSRLKAAAVVCGTWPAGLGTQGMLLEARAMLLLAPWAPSLVAFGLDMALGRAARDAERPEAFDAALDKLFMSRPPVDRDIWRDNVGGFRDVMPGNLREALKPGSQGGAHDAKLYGSDWGFELEDVEVEENTLSIWQGGLDKNVPAAMADKAVEKLKGCQYNLFPEEGHVSLISRKMDEYLDSVKGMMEA